MIQPEANPEDAKAVTTHLRMLSDAELSQAITSPRVLVGSLPGFTLDHLRTAAEVAVVQLAPPIVPKLQPARGSAQCRMLASMAPTCDSPERNPDSPG